MYGGFALSLHPLLVAIKIKNGKEAVDPRKVAANEIQP